MIEQILMSNYFIVSMALITTLYVCGTMISRTVKVLRLHNQKDFRELKG